MNKVVAGLEGCAVYLDNVVIHSDTRGEHVERIRASFDRLVWANLTVNLAKCEFAQGPVTYPGKVVGSWPLTSLLGSKVTFDWALQSDSAITVSEKKKYCQNFYKNTQKNQS